MRRRPFVLCALAAGCIEIPPPAGTTCEPGADADRDGWRCDGPAPDCADGDPAVHPGAGEIVDDGVDQDCFEGDLSGGLALPRVSVDDTERAVTTRELYVVFPDVDSSYPDSIIERRTGRELAYRGIDDHRGLGIDLWAQHITGTGDAGSVTVLRRGPAVVEMLVEWTWSDPQDDARIVDAATRLSFFADDRIVRHDHLDIGGRWGTLTYALASFTAVSPAAYTHVQVSGDEFPVAVDQVPEVGFEYSEDDTYWSCAITPGVRQLGILVRPTGGGADAGPRIVASGDPGDVRIELAYDWDRYSSSPSGSHDVSSVLTLAASSAIDCLEIAVAGYDFLRPAELAARPDGGAVVLDDPGDADLDGFAEQRGAYVVAAGDGGFAEVRVQDDPARPIAIETTLADDGATGVTVWLDGQRLGRDRDYLAQHDVALGTTTVWIAAPIAVGDVVRIAGPGGEPAP